MGNRAVILPEGYGSSTAGVYLHWNGGRASVEGFLAACRELGFRDPVSDDSYGMARLCFAVCTFICEAGTSVGIGSAKTLDKDNGDNGVYLVGKDWKIVGREHAPRSEEVNAAKTEEIRGCVIERVLALRAAAAKEGE